MAATIKNASVLTTGAITGSVRGLWQLINTDLETTDTAGLLKPYLITRADFIWLRVPDGATRVLLRGRNDSVATTFTTDPVVRLVGAFPTLPGDAAGKAISDSGFSATPGDTNHAEFLRLDSIDANAAGVTIDFAATTNLEDGTYEYTDIPAANGEGLGGMNGFDLKGATYVGLMVETAANVTGGATNVARGEVLFLN